MIVSKNNVLNRENKKPILWDVFYTKNKIKKPLVIFCHGYKGFKDWGAWDLVAKTFAEANMLFVKFNFSHNGGTIEQPVDFSDLEAFAENNYTKELDDLEAMINFLLSKNSELLQAIDLNKIILIGHSRGGGIATIKTAEDKRITNLITWAGVCDFEKRNGTLEEIKEWEKAGVKYVLNGRTKQLMPHNYQFYIDFKANEKRLNIEQAAKTITIPHLIIHALGDPSVKFEEAEALHSWNANSHLILIPDSNHVFDAYHPFKNKTLPEALKEIVTQTVTFITKKMTIS